MYRACLYPCRLCNHLSKDAAMKVIRVIGLGITLWLSFAMIAFGIFPFDPKLREEYIVSGTAPIQVVYELAEVASQQRRTASVYTSIILGYVIFLFFTSRSKTQ